MKPSVLLVAMTLMLVTLCLVGCDSENDASTRHTEALTILRRLADRDARYPMQDDLRKSKDNLIDATARSEAAERIKLNCADLARVRTLIEVGRPFTDYSPIEKLGRFTGTDPFRSFSCGLRGFITHQGPDPYTILIHVDATNLITDVGPIIMKH